MPQYQQLGELPRKHHIWFHRNGAGPGYKNEGIYYEHVTNVILDDLVKALRPRSITVEGDFAVRGGISSVIEATYQAKPRKRAR